MYHGGVKSRRDHDVAEAGTMVHSLGRSDLGGRAAQRSSGTIHGTFGRCDFLITFSTESLKVSA